MLYTVFLVNVFKDIFLARYFICVYVLELIILFVFLIIS